MKSREGPAQKNTPENAQSDTPNTEILRDTNPAKKHHTKWKFIPRYNVGKGIA